MIHEEVVQALQTIEQYEGAGPFLNGSGFPTQRDPLHYEDITIPNTPVYDEYNQAAMFSDAQMSLTKHVYDYNTFVSHKTDCDTFLADFEQVNTVNTSTTDPPEPDPNGCVENGYRSDASSVFDALAGPTASSPDGMVNVISTSSETTGSSDSDDDKFYQNDCIPVTVSGGSGGNGCYKDPNIKQRMADKIRLRRESEGVGEIPVAELFMPSKQYPMTPEEMKRDQIRKKRNRVSAEKSRKKRIAREKILEKEHDEEEDKNHKLLKEVRFLQAVKHLLERKMKAHEPICKLHNGVSDEALLSPGIKRELTGTPKGGEPSLKVSRSSNISEPSYSRTFSQTPSGSCTNHVYNGIAQQSTVSRVSSSSFPTINSQSLATATSGIAVVTPSITRQATYAWPAMINATSNIASSNVSTSFPVVTSPPPYAEAMHRQTNTTTSSKAEKEEAIRVIKEGFFKDFALPR